MEKNTKSILLVEDEAIIAMVEQKDLEQRGYCVQHVMNGEKAVSRALDPDAPYDLILMDINLGSGIDGTVAAEQILRQIEIPILFLSSHTEPEVVEKTETITSYGYVVKNSGITVLDASIKMALKLHDSKMKVLEKEEELTHFGRIIDNTPSEIFVFDAETMRFMQANREARHNTGYTLDELKDMTPLHLKTDLDRTRFEELVSPLKKRERDHITFETTHRRKDGSTYPVEVRLNLTRIGAKPLFVAIIQDISERKIHETKNAQLTRMYYTLSQVDQTIVRAKTRQELFDTICRVSVEFGKFTLAWIGSPEHESGDVTPLAKAGKSEEYLEGLRINIRHPQFGKGPTGRTLSTGRMAITENIETDANMGPWREKALKYDLRSSASVPLRLNGEVIATLNLYSDEPGFFTIEEQNLLEGMGMDISFALDAIEMEERRKLAEEKLRNREDALKKAQHTAHIGSWTWEMGTNRLEWSDEMYNIFDIDRENFTGNLTDVIARSIHPDDRNKVESANNAVIRDKNPLPTEYRIIRTDGTVRTVRGEAGELILDEGGRPSILTGIVQDITEWKNAEKAILESEQKFKDIFETANVGKSITLPTGEISINKAFADMLGYRIEELDNKTWQDLTPEEDIEATNEKLAPLIGGLEDSVKFKKRYNHKNGSTVWADINTVLRRNEAGKPLYYITTVVDITERVLTEDKLRLSEQRFASAFYSSPAGMTITRIKDGTFIDANDSFCQMFEFTREEVIGHTSTELNMWSHAEREKLIDEQLRTGGLKNYKLNAISKNGKAITILFSSKPLTLNGELHHVTTMIDITDRK